MQRRDLPAATLIGFEKKLSKTILSKSKVAIVTFVKQGALLTPDTLLAT